MPNMSFINGKHYYNLWVFLKLRVTYCDKVLNL